MSARPALALALATGMTALMITPAAHAAGAEWHYTVTAKVQMTARWSAGSQHDIGIPGEPCIVTHAAAGSATTVLHSRRPSRVLVLRGGRLPALDVGTGEGIPVVGSSTVQGTDATTHAGAGDCETANPSQAAPTTGCGTQSVKGALSLAFDDPHHLAADLAARPDRADCPTGPTTPLTWQDDTPPSLRAATASASPSRFYGTRQFIVHGSRAFTGTSDADDQATETVTWAWEATYRRERR